MGESQPHGFGLRRRFAHRRNIKGDIIVSGAASTITQLETLYYSSDHTTTTLLLGKAHLQTSKRRHHCQFGKVLLLQHVEEHGPRRQQQSNFLISPRLPQGHSLPLRQLIPLHINTYCDSDWATDIKSRKSTSGTGASVLGVPLALNSRTQSTVATSSAEAELYAIGLGISHSLHIYQLLQELQQHLQRPTCHFGDIDTQYNVDNLTTAKPLTSTNPQFTSSPTVHQLSASATSLASTKGPSTSL